MGFKKEVIEKLNSIEQRLAVNNKILETHEQRSNDLHLRIQPLEQSHVFVNKLSKTLVAIVTTIAALAATYHYLLSK